MLLPNRAVIALSGDDRRDFLQNLVTNDINAARHDQAVYACLLTPQGRFLHDFFVATDGDRIVLDCESHRRADLLARLKQFRLRAKLEIVDESAMWHVHSHSNQNEVPEIENSLSFPDPRHPGLGHRSIRLVTETDHSGDHQDDEDFETYDRRRIALGIPDGSRDMVPEQALLLENNIDALNGIAWNKGCYVGQELTARMYHKGGVKKRLTAVRIDGPPPQPGTAVMHGDKDVGEMRSSCHDIGLALLRIDAEGEFVCGDAVLTVIARDKG